MYCVSRKINRAINDRVILHLAVYYRFHINAYSDIVKTIDELL